MIGSGGKCDLQFSCDPCLLAQDSGHASFRALTTHMRGILQAPGPPKEPHADPLEHAAIKAEPLPTLPTSHDASNYDGRGEGACRQSLLLPVSSGVRGFQAVTIRLCQDGSVMRMGRHLCSSSYLRNVITWTDPSLSFINLPHSFVCEGLS